MKKKFKIMYPQDHPDITKAGKTYKPPSDSMIVMNGGGVFFEYCGETYYPMIQSLSDVIGNYDVVWK